MKQSQCTDGLILKVFASDCFFLQCFNVTDNIRIFQIYQTHFYFPQLFLLLLELFVFSLWFGDLFTKTISILCKLFSKSICLQVYSIHNCKTQASLRDRDMYCICSHTFGFITHNSTRNDTMYIQIQLLQFFAKGDNNVNSFYHILNAAPDSLAYLH